MVRHLSASQIGMFGRCQQQWAFRYLEGRIIPPGIAAHVGSGVHGGAEVSNKTALKTGQHEPESVVVDAAVQKYDERLRNDGVFFTAEEKSQASILLDKGKDETASLASLWRRDVAPTIEPFLVEQKAEIEVEGLQPTLLGYIDLYDAKGALRDLKTAGKAWSQGQADADDQMTIYREMVFRLVGTYPTEIGFDILIKNKTPKAQHISTVRDSSDFDVLVSKAKLMHRQIQSGMFYPADPGSWLCHPKWCGYYSICPWQSKRKIIALAAQQTNNEQKD